MTRLFRTLFGPRPAQPPGRQRPRPTRPAFRPEIERLDDRIVPTSGGGYTNGGLVGEYYANTTESGTASFGRSDERIGFAPNSYRPGGSISPAFEAVGATDFSVHWSGTLIPAFSETYTFSGFEEGSFVLRISPQGRNAWTTVIDRTAATGGTVSGAYALTAGQTYDVQIDYSHGAGAWAAQLQWSSPSTPLETVEPLNQVGINNPDMTEGFTDLVQSGRSSWTGANGGPAPAQDANGWPEGDGGLVLDASLNQGLALDPLIQGTVSFRFTGEATVKAFGNAHDAVYAYAPATNTTTGTFQTFDNHSNVVEFEIQNSHRNGASGPGGIANLQIMRPTAPNGTTDYSPATADVFTPQILTAMSQYTLIRFQYVANQQQQWSDATPPTFPSQTDGTTTAPHDGNGAPSSNGMSWEYKIMLANETGRDLMISIPTLATGATTADTTSYVYKLANLLKYGADANGTPYTSFHADPAYPPLNPNLSVYLELENELWNYSGAFDTDYSNLRSLTVAAIQANGSDLRAIDYDGLSLHQTNGVYDNLETLSLRMAALRMVQIGNVFRGVFGDAAMPGYGPSDGGEARVRPLFEWQYNNLNNTGSDPLAFIDNYFDNADGVAHVTTPRPVSYYLWGGGGANYYSSGNPDGLTTLLGDSDFSTKTLTAPGFAQDPSGFGWTFSGTAGVAQYGGTAGAIPPPPTGSQVGYVTDQGSMTATVTFPTDPTSNVYGVSFKALNLQSGSGAADLENLRVYLDYGTAHQVDITASTYSQGNGYTPPDYAQMGNSWNARNVYWTNSTYYYTRSFTVAAGSTHTITILGTGELGHPSVTGQTALVDAVQVTSVDAIFAGGLPAGGQATGQPPSKAIVGTMNGEASLAHAYGLREVSYESGWSLGGDDGGSWVQMDAKFGDSRAATAQATFLNDFEQSGSNVVVMGTYEQWPTWSDYYARQGLLNVAASPLVAGTSAVLDSLRPAPTNGTAAPGALSLGSANWTNKVTGNTLAAGSWVSWNVLVPVDGPYSFSTDAGSGGTQQILVDGVPVGTEASGTAATAAPYTVTLTPGFHTIRVACTSGSFQFNDLLVQAGVAPGAGPNLAAFDFYGNSAVSTGNNLAPTGTNPGVTVGTIGRGAGLVPNDQNIVGNVFASLPAGHHDATSLSAAVAGNEDYTFTVAPGAGNQMSLSGFTYTVFAQGGKTLDSAVEYSVNGGAWVLAGTSTQPNGAVAIALSDQTALQDTTGSVAFRIYVYGDGPYCTIALGHAPGNDVAVAGRVFTVADPALGAFNFSGTSGTQAATASAASAPPVALGSISRGSGLMASNQGLPGVFGNAITSSPSAAARYAYGATLAQAVQQSQYYQFTVTIGSGHTLALNALSFYAAAQNGQAGFGAGVSYSTDGVNFTPVVVTDTLGGARYLAPQKATADLSGISALQRASGTVTFRIYLFGAGAYEDTGIGGSKSDNDLMLTGTVN